MIKYKLPLYVPPPAIPVLHKRPKLVTPPVGYIKSPVHPNFYEKKNLVYTQSGAAMRKYQCMECKHVYMYYCSQDTDRTRQLLDSHICP